MNRIAVCGGEDRKLIRAVAALAAIGGDVVQSCEFNSVYEDPPTEGFDYALYPERKSRKAHLSKWYEINKAMGGR